MPLPRFILIISTGGGDAGTRGDFSDDPSLLRSAALAPGGMMMSSR